MSSKETAAASISGLNSLSSSQSGGLTRRGEEGVGSSRVCVPSHFSRLRCCANQGLQPARFLCSWGFSREKYWCGLPCPPPGDLPDVTWVSKSALAAGSFTSSAMWLAWRLPERGPDSPSPRSQPSSRRWHAGEGCVRPRRRAVGAPTGRPIHRGPTVCA